MRTIFVSLSFIALIGILFLVDYCRGVPISTGPSIFSALKTETTPLGKPFPFDPTIQTASEVESLRFDNKPIYIGSLRRDTEYPYFIHVSPITIKGIGYYVVQVNVGGRVQISLCPMGTVVPPKESK